MNPIFNPKSNRISYYANYATIDEDKGKITIYETEPNHGDVILKDVAYGVMENNVMSISGKQIIWCVKIHTTFVEDMDKKPQEDFTFLTYKTITDWFKRIKKPAVKFWYKLEESPYYHCYMTKWTLIQ